MNYYIECTELLYFNYIYININPGSINSKYKP